MDNLLKNFYSAGRRNLNENLNVNDYSINNKSSNEHSSQSFTQRNSADNYDKIIQHASYQYMNQVRESVI